MAAGMLAGAPGFQRTVAFLFSSETVALRTPGTPWIASVTCRAQLPHVMPLTARPVARLFCRATGSTVCGDSIFTHEQLIAGDEPRLILFGRGNETKIDAALIPFQPEMSDGNCRGCFSILDIFERAFVSADMNNFVCWASV